MTCLEAEELLLESLDETAAAGVRRALDDHLATCEGCTAFAVSLRAMDAQLTAALPPVLPPLTLAANVRTRIRRERRAAVSESLPDLIHLAGCSVATLLSAALLPIDAPLTIAAGIGFTCVTYVFMAVMRWSIEAASQPDW